MYRYLAIAMTPLLIGCSAMGTAPSLAGSSPQMLGATPATRESLTQVREVEIRPTPFAEERVCEMIAPTGTRIAQPRCYFRGPFLEESTAEARRDHIEALRRQHMRLEDRQIERMSIIQRKPY